MIVWLFFDKCLEKYVYMYAVVFCTLNKCCAGFSTFSVQGVHANIYVHDKWSEMSRTCRGQTSETRGYPVLPSSCKIILNIWMSSMLSFKPLWSMFDGKKILMYVEIR